MIRNDILTKVFFACVLVWLIILSYKQSTLLKPYFELKERQLTVEYKTEDPIELTSEDQIQENPEDKYTQEGALNKARLLIRTELADFNLTKLPGVKKLSDLIIENGGSPLRTMIISTWRSGSSFLGEIVNAVPSTFYNFEPLGYLEQTQVRGPPHSEMAINKIKKIFNCDYSNMDDYFNFAKHDISHMRRNIRLWDHCKLINEHCFDANFTSNFCSLFPFQSMKLVRLRLHLAEELLDDPALNIRLIFLIRDPRGVFQSRLNELWCRPFPDCIEPSLVCSDMVNDYITATYLSKKYPDRFIVVRYEDMALDTGTTAQKLLDFLHIGYLPEVENYLKTHTTMEIIGAFSTYRNSNDNAFRWKWNLDYDYVVKLQSECKEAMNYWGYVPAQNKTHLRNTKFNPITDYHL